MTEQEIFDKVLFHLREQGCASADTSGACLYRSPEGLMCAVGCLLYDWEYSPRLEGRGVCEAARDGWLPNRLSDDVGFLVCLQIAHDEILTADIEEWEAEMKRIADVRELKYTERTQ